MGSSQRKGRRARALAALVALSVFGISSWVALSGGPHPIDAELSRWAHGLRAPALRTSFLAITALGSAPFLTLVSVGLAAALLMQRLIAWSFWVLSQAIFGFLASSLLKLAFRLPRPEFFGDIELPSTYAYPSGHAMGATVVLGLSARVLCLHWPARSSRVIAFTTSLIVAIALSRVVLGVHWPSDVVGGMALGVLVLLTWRELEPEVPTAGVSPL